MCLLKHVLFSVIICCSFTLNAQQKNLKKKVVFIIVDGIAADMLKSNPSPRLDEIAKAGAYSDAYVGGLKDGYSETPTISAVGYNSLLTGVWANKHNVWGNSIKDPNYNYPTIFKLYKDANPNGKTAVFSTWLDNRTKLIGEGLPQTQNVKIDYAFDGFELDTVRFPHDQNREYIKNIDALVATEAAKYIETEAPDLSWVYLQYSDDIGHVYGDSPQLTAAIKYEDSLIGKIYDAVKLREKDHDEDWLFLVTTDHGRSAKDGKGHGGQSDRERSTWIVTNSTETNAYFKTETPAIVDLLPTMTSFLQLSVPKNIKNEWDGVSLLEPVAITQPKAILKDQLLTISWKNLTSKKIPVILSASTTNDFKTGSNDTYTQLGTAESGTEFFKITLKEGQPIPTKILFETTNTTLNTWVIQ
ncbi:type I phosphodiesterase/nucleotide pyrophosphatase [Gelidibacter algens]|uniref:Type I phosphodiesterase/nucleotide pyrophosphatase n=2 Tax=Gelidibacter algens TaxID=49280 RepID=A0A327RML2_9FLAO|nr:type I phosphodiesterase/nucleotide pyrophosphatase [Gelidibacter algens]